MQTALAFITAFYVAGVNGDHGVAPRGGGRPIVPTPAGRPGRPVRPVPGGNPWGCPQFVMPSLHSYCSQPGLECHYPAFDESFKCGNSWKWISMPPNPPKKCYKDGHEYADGFKFFNTQGCVEWECDNGRIKENDCPHPPSGCFKDGRTYPNHFQPPPDASGCVEWQCEDGKIRYNPCPAHPDGCWRHGFYYHDGYTQYKQPAHCPVWKCSNGHIEYLGECPKRKGCYKGGALYDDGFTFKKNGCSVWMCSDGNIRYLGGCPEPECEYQGKKHPVGTRIENYRGDGKNCASAQCYEENGTASFQCLFG